MSLQAADVSFSYGSRRVLHDVSLLVPPGSVVGLLGPNGSGKTTLLNLLAGIRRAVRGTVRLDGVPLDAWPSRMLATRIALVPQETHLTFDYSVLDIVLMGRHPHLGPFELEGPGDLEIARRALAATDALQFAGRAFGTLSGGEKQRVVIASALSQLEPGEASGSGAGAVPGRRIVLLDEPTAALDLRHQLELARLIRSMHTALGVTVVVSSHDLGFAAAVCQRLVLLREGRVLAEGPVRDVLTTAAIREVYDVDARVRYDDEAGRFLVVPIEVARGG